MGLVRYISTRCDAPPLDFMAATLAGLARDGGLYVPETWPHIQPTAIAGLAGRAYAVYGGVYIAASLLWLWMVEGKMPDRWDLTGAAICLAGAAVILAMPRQV